jgi:hypothetical protein
MPALLYRVRSDSESGVVGIDHHRVCYPSIRAQEDCAMPEGSIQISRLDKVSSILGPPLRGARSAAGESCSTRLR